MCFELCGLHKSPMQDQLQNFANSLARTAGMKGIQPRTPESWLDAFQQLERFVDQAYPPKKKRKRVVFLDELPWLDTPRSGFLSAFEQFWNSWCSRQKDLILVVCGSATSWMIREIVMARGGLHNRVTRRCECSPSRYTRPKSF